MSKFDGFAVMRLSKYAQKKLTIEEQLDYRKWPLNASGTKYRYHKPILKGEDLKIGDRVIVQSSFYDFSWGTVIEGPVVKSDNGNYVIIQFGGDDRNC